MPSVFTRILGIWQGGKTQERKTQEGKRSTYYRLNNRSHITLVPNGHLQDPMASTKIARARLSMVSPFAMADLSALSSGRRITAARSCHNSPLWRTHSRRRGLARRQQRAQAPLPAHDRCPKITVNAGEATLTKDGQRLPARILSPAGAVFEIASAGQNVNTIPPAHCEAHREYRREPRCGVSFDETCRCRGQTTDFVVMRLHGTRVGCLRFLLPIQRRASFRASRQIPIEFLQDKKRLLLLTVVRDKTFAIEVILNARQRASRAAKIF